MEFSNGSAVSFAFSWTVSGNRRCSDRSLPNSTSFRQGVHGHGSGIPDTLAQSLDCPTICYLVPAETVAIKSMVYRQGIDAEVERSAGEAIQTDRCSYLASAGRFARPSVGDIHTQAFKIVIAFRKSVVIDERST